MASKITEHLFQAQDADPTKVAQWPCCASADAALVENCPYPFFAFENGSSADYRLGVELPWAAGTVYGTGAGGGFVPADLCATSPYVTFYADGFGRYVGVVDLYLAFQNGLWTSSCALKVYGNRTSAGAAANRTVNAGFVDNPFTRVSSLLTSLFSCTPTALIKSVSITGAPACPTVLHGTATIATDGTFTFT